MIALGNLVNAMVFSMAGIVLFALAFIITDRLTPGSLYRDIHDGKNVAVAIVAGSVAISIAMIVAAAMHG
jgi:uncharacterized membrane protein YjfL (UPF0719 family)